jgi:hypothetical protein
MKKFATKLDEAAVRREFPIADLAAGWFFRCREAYIGGLRVGGTNLWGRRVWAIGTDRDELLRACAKTATDLNQYNRAILFDEYGTQLRQEGDELVLNVLCGRVGQYGVEFSLNDAECERYHREGDSFVRDLAGRVRQDPSVYRRRKG